MFPNKEIAKICLDAAQKTLKDLGLESLVKVAFIPNSRFLFFFRHMPLSIYQEKIGQISDYLDQIEEEFPDPEILILAKPSDDKKKDLFDFIVGCFNVANYPMSELSIREWGKYFSINTNCFGSPPQDDNNIFRSLADYYLGNRVFLEEDSKIEGCLSDSVMTFFKNSKNLNDCVNRLDNLAQQAGFRSSGIVFLYFPECEPRFQFFINQLPIFMLQWPQSIIEIYQHLLYFNSEHGVGRIDAILKIISFIPAQTHESLLREIVNAFLSLASKSEIKNYQSFIDRAILYLRSNPPSPKRDDFYRI